METRLSRAQKAVSNFHTKYGKDINCNFTPYPGLGRAARVLSTVASQLRADKSVGELRLHLIVEEVAELAQAMSRGDRVETLDALADAIYVLLGTAVSFGLPLPAAFDEVHRSNMTKTIEEDRPGHPGKGTGFESPDLQGVLLQDDSARGKIR